MIQFVSSALLARLPLRLSRALFHGAGSALQENGDSPKQLLIDISELIKHDAGTGIQRVVRGITPYLMENPPAGYSVRPVFAEKGRGYHYAPVTSSCLQADEVTRRNSQPVIVNSGDIFLGLDLAAHLLPRHGWQLLRWRRRGAKLCFLVYDLLPLLYPHWFNSKRSITFNRWLRTLAIFGDDLICISEAVKADLQCWLSLTYSPRDNIPRLHTIPMGADIASTIPSSGCTADELELMGRVCRRPFVLMVGTLEPRKGYTQALQAFEQIWRSGMDALLVIVGKPGWKTESLQEHLAGHAEQGKKLFWFGRASDELLRRLYHAASGVLVASEAEGYGLPLIEAAQYGKPVLARDIPVFRETAAPGTSFFEAGSFAESLGSWIQRIQSAGFVVSQTIGTSWADSAARLAEIVAGAGG